MKDQEYNGWKNKETWIVVTWIANDAELYAKTKEMNAHQLRDLVDLRALSEVGATSYPGLLVDLQAETLDRIDWVSIEESLSYVEGGKETELTKSVYLVSDTIAKSLGEIETHALDPRDLLVVMRSVVSATLGGEELIDENGLPAWLEVRDENGTVICSDKKEILK